MTFQGTLTDLETSTWKDQTYHKASVVDDRSPHGERLKTEVVVGIPSDGYNALQGKIGQPVQVTLRLFRSVRNGLPEFEGRVTLPASGGK